MQVNQRRRLSVIVTLFIVFAGCRKEEIFKVPPKADFFFIITNPGLLPAEVKFSSMSTNADTLKWDFNNGTASTIEKPIAIYSERKVFLVKLVVSNAAGKDSITREVKISGMQRQPRIITGPKSDPETFQRETLP